MRAIISDFLKNGREKLFLLLMLFLTNEVLATTFIPKVKTFQEKLMTVFFITMPFAILLGIYELKFGKDGGFRGRQRIENTIVGSLIASTAVWVCSGLYYLIID